MKFIAVSAIAGKDATIEISCTLIAVVTSPIQVVEVKSESHALIYIGREIRLEAIFTSDLITSFIVSDIGIRNVAVGEIHLTGTLEEKACIRLEKQRCFCAIVAFSEKT